MVDAAPRPRHRLSPIVSLDVVGYSTMMAKDAEATVRIVDDYNDTVVLPASKAHGGRLITRMGDGWLL